MLKRKLPLLFTSMVICLVLILSGCTPKIYQLSTSVTPSGGGTVSPSGGPFSGKVTVVAAPAQNYAFIGWAGAASGNTNPLTVTMDSDKQIVAQFKRLQSTIQVTSNPSNGGTVLPASGIFDTGSTAIFTVTPNSGYRFLNWGGDASGNVNPLSISINSNKILTANFIKQYTLVVTADPNTGTVNPQGGTFDAGSTVNLTATPLFPFAFKSWVGADNNTLNPATVTMKGDVTVSLNVVQCIKDDTQSASGPLAQNMGFVPTVSIQIQLKKGEWIQGQIITDTNPLVYANIKDPSGNMVKDFGAPGQANFTFSAQVTGPYTITFQNNTIWVGHYSLSYNIYHLP